VLNNEAGKNIHIRINSLNSSDKTNCTYTCTRFQTSISKQT